MKKLKKEDIKQEVFDLYDAFVQNKPARRDFIEKLSLYAVGSVTVPALISFLMPNYKDTLLLDLNDPRLDSKYINYNSPKGWWNNKRFVIQTVRNHRKIGVYYRSP